MACERRISRIRTRPHLLLFLAAFSLCGCSRQPSTAEAFTPEQQALRDKVAGLSRREKLLGAELSLAKSPVPYVAVDLQQKRIELKVQGRSLRSFPITGAARSDDPGALAETWAGIEARPLRTPVRAKVVPGSGEATSSSNAVRDPWGPMRMPAEYDLICKGRRALEIRSLQSDQAGYLVTRWVVNGYRRAKDWTRDLFSRNAPYDKSIEIWMKDDDARLLFWSLPKQFGILVVNPS